MRALTGSARTLSCYTAFRRTNRNAADQDDRRHCVRVNVRYYFLYSVRVAFLATESLLSPYRPTEYRPKSKLLFWGANYIKSRKEIC